MATMLIPGVGLFGGSQTLQVPGDGLIYPIADSYSIVIADSAHAHSAESPAVLSESFLTVADAGHGHTAENADLVIQFILSIADCAHAHTAENSEISLSVLMVFHDSDHGHISDVVLMRIDTRLYQLEPKFVRQPVDRPFARVTV